MPDSPGLGGSSDLSSLVEIHRAVLAETGARLFTILAFTDGGRTMHRIYSSHPHEYPVGGRKDVTRDVAADWLARCVDEQAPYFGRTRDDVRRIFADSALIESLGCGSIINAPVVRDGLTIGALNILDAEGAYGDDDVEKALAVASRSADVVAATINEMSSNEMSEEPQ
ncbi:GAF domain-containing protein [Promicromonospora panici]|uniref:GAF domain-containing protein n=1 Tax=Promicromonospora panici TaxID=2219658 RepID=UPI001A90F3A0|nr:GAF domain-containing protein [Promicromonospora panici]